MRKGTGTNGTAGIAIRTGTVSRNWRVNLLKVAHGKTEASG